ncbi:MAG: L-seryl-tRNA(Sec) selenium transferase, partial [Leptolyngbya sp.]|nr:L-seryl-tRNA(Sec) selenium transferase [Candidatus Melainabacteria bacterium]
MDKTEIPGANLRNLPQVDKVIRHPLVQAIQDKIHPDILARLARRELAFFREEIIKGGAAPSIETAAQAVADGVSQLLAGSVQRVINGTGVILNTNLGRAPLPMSAVERLNQTLPGYCSLEIDLATGKRGERTSHLELLLSLLTGCQSAIVVNNNAAAVMLSVSALASGKEVVVSRGELIEIGGSFRLPDVITSAGGILKEVGTTNRTRVDDYRNAISANTGLLLRCHRSNYEIRGFTEQPKLAELAALAEEVSIPFIEDLGSGAVIDLAGFGLKDEPTVPDVIQAGADAVLFSGDKLLGGLQSGIIAGKRSVVERLKRHP